MPVLREIIEKDIEEKKLIAKQVRWIKLRQIIAIVIGVSVLLAMIANLFRLEHQINKQDEIINALILNLRAINDSIP